MARHCRRLCTTFCERTVNSVGTRESGCGGENAAASFACAIKTGSDIRKLWRRSINVVAPIFDLLLASLRILTAQRRFGSAKFATQEPLKGKGEKEFDNDDGQDEDERNV